MCETLYQPYIVARYRLQVAIGAHTVYAQLCPVFLRTGMQAAF